MISNSIKYLFRLEPMPEHVLQDDEEVLQRDVVGVQLPAEPEAGVDHLLDHQAQDAHQVAALHQGWVSSCKKKCLIL